jgi:hypothetical protein
MSPITMTEVWLVVKNGLWILGLSILLAIWSYARYTAYEAHVKTRGKLNEPKYALMTDLGLLLFVAGMAATETRWWGRILWILLSISIIVQRVLRVKELQTAADKPNDTTSGEGPAQ